jgi:predicted acylesterase/phospholipase RssA
MIKNLIVSGGSTKTIAVIGCLKYLEEQGLLVDIKTFVGTSAGSLVCFFLVLGYTVGEMVQMLKHDFFGEGLHVLGLDELYTLEMLNSFGMDSGLGIMRFLADVLFLKLQKRDVTFLELAKLTGKNLVVGVANITQQRSEHFCVDNQGTTSVLTALRMSVSLPFIFTPVRFGDDLYVDGGIYEALPTSYVNSFTDPLRDTLALNTVSVIRAVPVSTFVDFVSTLLTSIIQKASNYQKLLIGKKIRVIDIEFEDVDTASFSFDSMSFNVDDAIIFSHLEKGYNVIKQCFEQETP